MGRGKAILPPKLPCRPKIKLLLYEFGEIVQQIYLVKLSIPVGSLSRFVGGLFRQTINDTQKPISSIKEVLGNLSISSHSW